jgi:radical SAM superfamily enzyme YgiQ (UPF0313 family)
MHVIFLNSIYTLIPQRSLGPYLLKHQLKKHGYSSQVIDFCQDLTADQIHEFVKKFASNETICLAISSTFWFDETQFYYTYDNGIPPNIYKAIKLIKQTLPDLKIILGGAHSGYMWHRIEDIDYIFIGESEDTFIEVLDHWTKGSQEPQPEINVRTKKLIYKGPLEKKYEIQSCDFMWDDNDCIIDGEALPMETARGCIFTCRFCAYPHLGKKKFDYLKSNDTIKNHLITNYNKWKTTSYIMLDDTFNDSEYKIDGFLELTRSLPFSIEYAAYIRADLVHRFKGMAEKLAETGLRGAFFGLESLHPTASQIVGKGWSGKSAKEFVPELVHNIWKNKISAHCGLIVGLPGEGEEDLQTSLKWANDNMINVIFFGLQVANNLKERSYVSEFERNADKYGFKFDANNKWYNDTWSRASVVKYSIELNNKRKRMNYAGFNQVALHSLGFTNEEILSIHPDKMVRNNQEFYNRKKVFLQTYIDKLNSLN